MAMLEHLDLGIGAVVKKLKDEKLWDNTLLFFLTDNGTAAFANDPEVSGKNTMTENGLRIPLVVNGPGVTSGVASDAMVHIVDVLPTVVELTGGSAEWPVPLDGRSLLPLLTEPDAPWDRELLYSEKFLPVGIDRARSQDWRAVRNGRFKLLCVCACERLA